MRLQRLTLRYRNTDSSVRQLRREHRTFRRENADILKRHSHFLGVIQKKTTRLAVVREELVRFAHPEVKIPLVPCDYSDSDSG